MTRSELINAALFTTGSKACEICKMINLSPQSFSQKLKRGTFTDEEACKIAEALGGTYEQCIKLNSSKTIK